MNNETRLRALLAVLLVASAALFAIGTSIERSQRKSHTEAIPGAQSSGETGGETGGGSEATPKATAETHTDSSEKLFGIDTESVPLTVGAVIVSLLFAAAVWWRRERLWLWLTAAFGVVFAVGDVRELAHQLNESRTGVAIIAAILIGGHLLVAAISGLLLRQPAAPVAGPVAAGPVG